MEAKQLKNLMTYQRAFEALNVVKDTLVQCDVGKSVEIAGVTA